MLKFSKAYLRDSICACWLGKNIGGTIGTPYEGRRELLDIEGFSTPPGKPLPNDDLDLQLVWLLAMDELGPERVNSKVLGEYWLSYIDPNWNEYGVGKANMRAGLVPPLSGEVSNTHWKNSNGAWIRTEIWASLYPGQVEKAVRFAFEDACVDHGFAEGSYAAIFVAAMESAAYVIKDIPTLIDIGLSKIPEDCRVAASVKLVLDSFAKGLDWKEVRKLLIEQSADLGWFQAPANVGYVILGLLYGKGDFKQSVIYAVDCGDDTDCTGATVGALLGIIHGMAGIPADWRQHIGDEIVSACLAYGYRAFPRSCTELTDCVMNLLPVTLRTGMPALMAQGVQIELGEENDFSAVSPESLKGRSLAESFSRRSRWSFTAEGIFADAVLSFDREPVIAPGETLSGKIALIPHTLPEARRFTLRWILPAGWQAAGRKSLFTATMPSFDPNLSCEREDAETEFTITAGEQVEGVNELLLDIMAPGRPSHLIVPITILG